MRSITPSNGRGQTEPPNLPFNHPRVNPLALLSAGQPPKLRDLEPGTEPFIGSPVRDGGVIFSPHTARPHALWSVSCRLSKIGTHTRHHQPGGPTSPAINSILPLATHPACQTTEGPKLPRLARIFHPAKLGAHDYLPSPAEAGTASLSSHSNQPTSLPFPVSRPSSAKRRHLGPPNLDPRTRPASLTPSHPAEVQHCISTWVVDKRRGQQGAMQIRRVRDRDKFR